MASCQRCIYVDLSSDILFRLPSHHYINSFLVTPLPFNSLRSFFVLQDRVSFLCQVQFIIYIQKGFDSSYPFLTLSIDIMIAQFSALLLGAATLTSALPAVEKRTVPSLNQAAFKEAQQRDNTATRAFSSVEIKVCHSVPLLKLDHLLMSPTDFIWTVPLC
jgi:hypothetical protein